MISINMLINGSLGKRDLGTNSLTENSYAPYLNYFSAPFPSGDFRKYFSYNLESNGGINLIYRL